MKVTSITFPSLLVRTNTYYPSGDARGFLRTQADLGFRTNSFGWSNGNLICQTNALGLITTNTWDGLNRLTSTRFPDGTSLSNRFDKLDLVGRRDRLGNWTWYAYNSVRQLTSTTNAAVQVTQYDYCDCGSLGSITRYLGARGLVTQFQHDILGRLTNTVYPDGYQVSRTYGPRGLLDTLSDSGGRSLRFDYFQLGLGYRLSEASLVSATLTTQRVLSRTYDEYGRLTNSVDRNGVAVTNAYDLLGRVVARRLVGGYGSGECQSGLETFVYDVRGLTNYIDALGHLTSYVRDAAGQVLFETNAHTKLLQYTYNPAGDLASLTDAKLHTTTWNYDEYGRVTNKVDATGTQILSYQYDPAGRLTNRLSAAKGNTAFRYDAVGNLTNVVYPLSSNITFAYDSLNRLTNMTDGLPGPTSFSWTDGDQLASEDGPWTRDTVSFSYTHRLRGLLRLAQPNASDWTQSYLYDDYVRLAQVTSPAGAFEYLYPSSTSDLLVRMNLPGGAFAERSYDDLARVTDLVLRDPLSNPLDRHRYSYNDGSQRTQQVFTAGNHVNYTYDNIGQLKTAKGWEDDNETTPRLHEQFGYAYDAAWNLNYRTNNALVQSFAVNNLNQLSTAGRSGTLTVAGAVESSSPPLSVTVSGTGLASGAATVYNDGSWARAGATLANGANSYTASATDGYSRTAQDTVAVNLPTSVSFTYDGNGNLTSDGQRTFAYDDENQLTSVTVSNAWRSEFVYDGLCRRRIRKEYTWFGGTWIRTNEVHYIYDNRLVVQERDPNNVPLVTYTRGADLSGDLQEAGGIGGLLARTDNPQFNGASPQLAHAYYHCDAGGNVTCLMNSNSVAVASYTYDPFGNVLAATGPLAAANLYRFSSKEWHQNSGLVHYLYRHYDARLQRWVNSDPVSSVATLVALSAAFAPWSHSDQGMEIAPEDVIALWRELNANTFVAFDNAPPDNIDAYGLFTAGECAEIAGDFFVGGLQGIAAAVDGAIPIVNPLGSAGLYNPNDPTLKASRALGATATIALGGAGALRVAGIGSKIAIHGPHHNFGRLGRLWHLQLNVWRDGVKGSGRACHMPLPWR